MFTCKHGDFVNVMELPKVFAVEAGPQVSNQNLSPLVQSHPSAMEDRFISETGEVLCKQVHESCGGFVNTVNAVGEATTEFLVES